VIGRFGGAPIVVRPGWLLATVLLAVVSAPIARAVLPGVSEVGAYVVGFGFGFLLLASVLVHELAHAWVARRRGVTVRQVVLTLVGGHTEMADSGSPTTGALVAVAGPLANVALAALGWLGFQLTQPGPFSGVDRGALHAAFGVLAYSNALVAAFNLLPGLPMDGGWILEAIVWRLTGRRNTGTRAAAYVGRVVAVGLLVGAVGVPLARSAEPDLTAVLWSAVIGVTLWTSAGGFLRLAAWRDAVAGIDLVRLARPAALTGARTLAELPPRGHDGAIPVVVADGRLRGYVDPGALAAVPAGQWPVTPVDAVLVPLPAQAWVDGTLTGAAALAAVGEVARSTPVMAVRDADGAVVGLLRYADLVEALRRTR